MLYLIEGDAPSDHQKTHPTEKIDREDPNFDRKLDDITADLPPWFKRHLLERITRENAAIIV